MRSYASLKGHSVHPMLIPFPMAFVSAAFLFDAASWIFRRPSLSMTAGDLRLAHANPYERLAWIYDWMFGLPLQPGRVAAIRQLNLAPGEAVLEVGIGTGLNATLYPGHCSVVGIDACAAMLERASRRLTACHVRNVRLLRMDAMQLSFPDGSFDVVYAPYLVTTVPDPVQVGREMSRVCAPGGRIVMLNHFLSSNSAMSWLERHLSSIGASCGFRPDLELGQFLLATGLEPIRIDRVNFPPIWSLVICRKPGSGRSGRLWHFAC